MSNHNNNKMFSSRQKQVNRSEFIRTNYMKTHFCPACLSAFTSDEAYKDHWKKNHSRTLDNGKNHGI